MAWQSGAKESASQRTKKPTKEKDAPPCLNFLTKKAPYKGLGADSEEKHEPVSDIDTAVVDSLKALDPNRPIREATAKADMRAVGDAQLLRLRALPCRLLRTLSG